MSLELKKLETSNEIHVGRLVYDWTILSRHIVEITPSRSSIYRYYNDNHATLLTVHKHRRCLQKSKVTVYATDLNSPCHDSGRLFLKRSQFFKHLDRSSVHADETGSGQMWTFLS